METVCEESPTGQGDSIMRNARRFYWGSSHRGTTDRYSAAQISLVLYDYSTRYSITGGH